MFVKRVLSMVLILSIGLLTFTGHIVSTFVAQVFSIFLIGATFVFMVLSTFLLVAFTLTHNSDSFDIGVTPLEGMRKSFSILGHESWSWYILGVATHLAFWCMIYINIGTALGIIGATVYMTYLLFLAFMRPSFQNVTKILERKKSVLDNQ